MSLKTDLRADLILLLTAFIWGLAFVYQRTGMDHIGPWGDLPPTHRVPCQAARASGPGRAAAASPPPGIL